MSYKDTAERAVRDTRHKIRKQCLADPGQVWIRILDAVREQIVVLAL